MPKKESITQKYAKKAKFSTPTGAGVQRDSKLKKAEDKALGKKTKKK